MEDFYARSVRGIDHWAHNDRFLVVGDYWGGTGPEPELNEYHGIAQYNPNAEFSHWEPFGYPIVDDLYWIENDGFSGAAGVANVVAELALPGKRLDQAVVVGGDYEYVFGYASGALNFKYTAWLDPADGSFEEISGLNGEVKTLGQAPDYLALDGGTYLYAAGDFGTVPGGEGLVEEPSVMSVNMGGNEPGVWEPLLPGGYPHPGPMTEDEFTSAVINEIIVTRDYVYAIGDFDRVLEHRGFQGPRWCGGFARFSFSTQRWEALNYSMNGASLAAEIAWPSIFLGGEFTEVSGAIASYHIAEAIFGGAMTGAPIVSALADGLQFETPRPNPARRGVRLLYSIRRPMTVDLAIYDVSGRLVTRLAHGQANAGAHLVDWDGRSAEGTWSSPGIYLARITAGDSCVTRKITVLR